MLILILLVFSFRSSNAHNELLNCSSDKICPTTFAPMCAGVEHKEDVYIPKYIQVQNACDLEKLKCHKGVHVSIVPMANCYSEKAKQRDGQIARRRKEKGSGVFAGKVDMQVIEISLRSEHPDVHKLGEWTSIPVSFGFVVDVAILSKKLLPKIRNIIKSMTDLVENDASRTFKDLLLTVYAWPTYNGTYVTRTSNAEEFSVAVENLETVTKGEKTCAAQVYQSTISALQKALPHSHMYVFVSGMPSEEDVNYKSEVVRLALEKNIEVNFVGTGLCADWSGYETVVHTFYDIAADTYGQVLKIDPALIEAELPKYVKATVLEFERKVLVSEVIDNENFQETRIAFSVKEEHAFVTVTVSGEYIRSIVFDSRNNSVEDFTPVVHMNHIKVDQYKALEVGEYFTRLYSEKSSRCGLLTVATSNVEFYYYVGFSTRNDQKSLAAAVGEPGRDNPKAGNLEYVVIHVTSPRNPINVKYVEFYDLDGNMIAQHALKVRVLEPSLRVYKTDQIEINVNRFKVAVTGIHRVTEKLVRSVAPRVVRPYKVWPNEKTSGEKEKDINDGKGSEEKQSGEQIKSSDYQHISSDSYSKDSHSESHYDYSDDSNNEDHSNSEELLEPQIIKNEQYTCKKLRNKWVVLWKCSVSKAQTFSMKWILKVDIQNGKLDKEILTGGNEEVDLLVNQKEFKGTLTCVAKNKAGEDQYTINIKCPKGKVKTHKGDEDHGRVAPKVRKLTSQVISREGEKVKLTCQILEGSPVPTVTWRFKPNQKSSWLETLYQTGQVLVLKSVTKKDGGSYQCLAKNPYGKDVEIIQLVVQGSRTNKLHGAISNAMALADYSDEKSINKLKLTKTTLDFGNTAPPYEVGDTDTSYDDSGENSLKIVKNNEYSCKKLDQKWVLHKECRVKGTKSFQITWNLELQKRKENNVEVNIKDVDDVDLIVNQNRFKGTLTCKVKSKIGEDRHTISVSCPKHWKNKLGKKFLELTSDPETLDEPVSIDPGFALICPSNTSLIASDINTTDTKKLSLQQKHRVADPGCPIANA